jgi:hypothetical protein
VHLELHNKKKSIAETSITGVPAASKKSHLNTDLWAQIPGEEVMKSIDMQGIALNIGITIEGFGAPTTKSTVAEAASHSSFSGMPDKAQLDSMYKKLMDELGLNESSSQKISELSDDSKWAMINQNRKLQVTILHNLFSFTGYSI